MKWASTCLLALALLANGVVRSEASYAPHIDHPDHSASWRQAQQHVPQTVGEIDRSEVVAMLIATGWDPNWAQRVADANVWVIDATLPGGSGVYYGAHDPLTQQGHIYVGTLYVFHPGTIGHEAEHWVDHSRGLLDEEAFIAFKRSIDHGRDSPGCGYADVPTGKRRIEVTWSWDDTREERLRINTYCNVCLRPFGK